MGVASDVFWKQVMFAGKTLTWNNLFKTLEYTWVLPFETFTAELLNQLT